MTEDYKNTLLKYLTGNLNIESGENIPQYSENNVSESSIGYYLEDNAGSGYEIIDILQGYQSTYSFIYGNTANNKGFIVIIDENYNPVQYIDSYASGTSFGTFKILNIAEDGNVYGVDVNNSTPRFIMLNNITLLMPNQSNFIVKLRQSYNLPSPLSTATNYFAITKAVGQAKYLFGYIIKTQANHDNPKATQLTINVGASNDWVDYSINGDDIKDFTGCSIWASWDGDTVNFRLDGYSTDGADVYYQRWELFEGRLVGFGSILSIEGLANGYWSINTIAVNQFLSYIGIYDGGTNGEAETIKIMSYSTRGEFTYSTVIATYQKGVNAAITGVTDRVQFKVLNGVAYFMTKNYERYSSTNNLYLYIGMAVTSLKNVYGYIVETGDVYDTYTMVAGDTETYKFYISNLYNLYNYNILGLDFSSSLVGGTNVLIQQIYNPNNYNGIAYENNNSLIPNSGVLYDSNGMMIFARNLYNKTLFRNTTVSTIEIPNTMINDITIAPQNLLGMTNKILNSNTESFTKNIYETVYLNYYNTLLIQDRNTPDYVTNLLASESLNNSISLNADYNEKQATKCRANYNDNTNYVFEIHPTITGNQNTVTGSNTLYLTSNLGENPLSYSVNGVCQQNGTPTPSTPVEIKTLPSDLTDGYYCKITVKNADQSEQNNILIDVGKENLISTLSANWSARSNGSINKSAGAQYLSPQEKIEVEPNTTYSIVFDGWVIGGNRVLNFAEYDVDNTFIRRNTSLRTATFTTGSTTKYIFPYLYDSSSPFTTTGTQIQMFESNDPTPYYELCKVGDYTDVLLIDDSGNCTITKNVRKIPNYNGETITTTYMSTTGQLTTGATIYYGLTTPETITLENTQIPLFEGTNYVTFEGINTNTSITYKMQKKAIYDIRICVPSDKLINSIDIISQDETVTYQTIPNLNTLENNKYYQIIQDCYIE